PGFYYWDKTRWVRLVSDAEAQEGSGGNVYYDGTQFEYEDEQGVRHIINLADFVKARETITTLINNRNGTYTYTSENGTRTIINVPQDVIDQFETIINNETVKNQILELLTVVGGGNVYYDGSRFEYIDANGVKRIIDISAVVKANETITTLVNNGNGTYTYTSENGTKTIVNVPQDVIDQFEKIINNETVKNKILELLTVVGGGNVYYDGTRFTYADANGVVREIDLSQIVKSLETLTTLVNNGDGTYTYTSENGTKTIVNVPQDVIDQFEKIINNETVKNKILELLTVVGGGNVYYDGTRFTYADANGVVREIDLSQIVKSLETLTTLVNNGDGTYTYTSENGTQTIVNVPQDVIDQFETIINNETVKNQILELLTVVGGGNVYYNGTRFTYADANGVVREIDLSQIVKSLETLTTLVNNGDGTYTYTSENGTKTIVNVPQDVIDQFEKIINNETVKNKILELLTVVGGGNVYYDGTRFTYADANGVVREIDLSQIVKSLETLTTLVNNGDGTYTYTSENGTKTIVNVPQDVIDQFEKIINNETVKNQLLELLTVVGGGNVYYDGTRFTYADANGVVREIDLSQIVKSLETLTTLVNNGDGTYTYTSENGTKTIVNVPQDVIDQFEKIINNETVKNKILELLTVVGGGNVYYDGTRFTYADANGVIREIDLSQIVKSLETLTTLVNNGDGTYTYTSENGTKTIVNVP
ncbi:hypothetical protein, partial [Myroides sp. WP-1]|uniref:hypothetical protein n=1 Tax=Myroides sp. WP-1 TaxID=2759944 RepID=UPI0015FB9F93